MGGWEGGRERDRREGGGKEGERESVQVPKTTIHNHLCLNTQ